MKPFLKIMLLVAAFTVASGATYVVIHRWSAAEHKRTAATKPVGRQDTLEGVTGLTEGEVVALPQLTTLTGETVSLGNLGKERLLCVFFGNKCPGCMRDAELWNELHKEAQKSGAAFYLINVGDERAEIEKFVTAYNLHHLSILFDPSHQVGPRLKVGFLPQYILFDRNGQVLHRWDGIRYYDKSGGMEQLAEFFSVTGK